MKKLSKLPLLAATLALASHSFAQTWTGNLSNDFNDAGNWSAPLSTNSTLQINGPGAQGNTTLVNATYTFTGTGGKIAAGGTSNMTITGGTINLFNGVIDGILAGSANTTFTVGSNIVLGNGSVSTHHLTSNVANVMLAVTGNITGGTGGTPGIVTLSLGSTGTKNGDYNISGNIAAGGASSITVTKRGTGTATFSGTNVIGTLNNTNEAGSNVVFSGGNTTVSSGLNFSSNASAVTTVRVTGGELNLTMADTASGWGTGTATSLFQVSGGTVNTVSGRNIDPSILIDGGTLNVNAPASRMTFNNANSTLTVTSGALNVGATSFGLRLGNAANGPNQSGAFGFTGNQTGGTVTVIGNGASTTVFSMGGNDTTSGLQISYNLSGGTLDVGNATTNTNGWLQLGANSNGNGTVTLSLSGTGKLISRFNPGTTGGIAGMQAGAVQVLSLTGGTLVAGRIEAANLRGSISDAAGTIINNGASIAPGDVGTAGRTSIQGGNLTLSSGTILLDILGTTQATTFQDTTPGRYDNILVSGILNYGGTLSLSFGSFTPTVSQVFDLFGGFTSQTGTFSSITFSDPGIEGTFDYGTGDLTITAVPEPSTWALIGAGLGGLLLLRRRRKA